MVLKGIEDFDHVNYKKFSMFLVFPNCTFKCGKEFCQNSALAKAPTFNISVDEICERYLNNPLTEAVVIGGMEPFDSDVDLLSFCGTLRNKYDCKDDIVIYTGYTEKELENGWRDDGEGVLKVRQGNWQYLKELGNIIVKFGRFIPNDKPRYDEVLGIDLVSSNQYAKKY